MASEGSMERTEQAAAHLVVLIEAVTHGSDGRVRELALETVERIVALATPTDEARKEGDDEGC